MQEVADLVREVQREGDLGVVRKRVKQVAATVVAAVVAAMVAAIIRKVVVLGVVGRSKRVAAGERLEGHDAEGPDVILWNSRGKGGIEGAEFRG